MSTDAQYILCYYNLGYLDPTPMKLDVDLLKEKYGGYFETITKTTIFWDKPKHTLLTEEIRKLHADQVLERKSCELWEIVK